MASQQKEDSVTRYPSFVPSFLIFTKQPKAVGGSYFKYKAT